MTTRNLVTAFTAALNRGDRADPPPAPAPCTADLLIHALRHSATDRDQIMLRRIGLMTATIPDTPATTG